MIKSSKEKTPHKAPENSFPSTKQSVPNAPDNKTVKIPLWCKISLIFSAVCAIVYVFSCINADFADFFNNNIGAFFRMLFAKISGIFPFSLAEIIIILSPLIIFFIVRWVLKYGCITRQKSATTSVCILTVAALMLSAFTICFATGYRGRPLEEKLGLESRPVSAEDLKDTAEYLASQINELAPQIEYLDGGFSKMPYSFSEMNKKLLDAYDSFCLKYTFIKNFKSKLKPVLLSKAMSYTHITGVYSFFTGEANLNVDFPDYTLPYTAAHELAHQRGIAREDEANMIAFLVCLESEDQYIRYSAYLSIYEYVAGALYVTDRDAYHQVNNLLDRKVVEEEIAYAEFYKQYSKSISSKVTGAVNDAYLKLQGTEGSVSYGMVTDLTVAYFISLGILQK